MSFGNFSSSYGAPSHYSAGGYGGGGSGGGSGSMYSSFYASQARQNFHNSRQPLLSSSSSSSIGTTLVRPDSLSEYSVSIQQLQFEREAKSRKHQTCVICCSFICSILCYSLFFALPLLAFCVAYWIWFATPFSLVSWQIAPIISFYLLMASAIVSMLFVIKIIVFHKTVPRISVSSHKRHSNTNELVARGVRLQRVFTLLEILLYLSSIALLLIFFVWAQIPALLAHRAGEEFDLQFRTAYGSDYESLVPIAIRRTFLQQYFSYARMLSFRVPKKFITTLGVSYGSAPQQFFDVYSPIPENVLFNGSLPCLLQIHGGATVDGNEGNFSNRKFPEIQTAAYFASQSIVVISLQYRTVPDGANFVDMVSDVRTAISFLKQNAANFSIDPNQIFLLGRSRGGQLATCAAYSGMSNDTWYEDNAGDFTSEELSVRGIIDLYGAVDPFESASFGEKLLVNLNEKVMGTTLEADPMLYRNASSPFLVGPSSPPTLIVHGLMDRIVFPAESDALYSSLVQQQQNNTISNGGSQPIYLRYALGSHGFDAFSFTPGGQLFLYFAERFIWHNFFRDNLGF